MQDSSRTTATPDTLNTTSGIATPDTTANTVNEAVLPRSRWRALGPGLIAAATGVGAGDLIATLAAGSAYGYTLFWAVVLGVLVKIALGEGVGCYHLATRGTILRGWRSLGRWTSVYFGLYVVVWGFIYGATAMTATGLPLNVLFPVFSAQVWGALCAFVGLALVWWGGYRRFERLMGVLVGVMFVSVVGIALLVTPDLPNLFAGFAPRLPPGSLLYSLGLLGGVGGTITMAAYGYWFNAKGWRGPEWLPFMRFDNAVGYAMTGLFVVSMMIVGAELLFTANIALAEGNGGLVALGEVLRQRFGTPICALFMVGFWATSMTSILGVWNGVSLMFGDFARDLRGRPAVSGEAATKTPEFRLYTLWLTFPPLILLFQFADSPVQLVLIYGALGAFFMPFLAGTLLFLLNRRVEPQYRSGFLSNAMLTVALLLFAALCINELLGLGG